MRRKRLARWGYLIYRAWLRRMGQAVWGRVFLPYPVLRRTYGDIFLLPRVASPAPLLNWQGIQKLIRNAKDRQGEG